MLRGVVIMGQQPNLPAGSAAVRGCTMAAGASTCRGVPQRKIAMVQKVKANASRLTMQFFKKGKQNVPKSI